MQPTKMILVAGFPGCGKTCWIQQHWSQQRNNGAVSAMYLNLGAGATPIDATYIGANVPGLMALTEAQLVDFLHSYYDDNAGEHLPVYIELGFHVDPASLVLPFNGFDCERVAIVPPKIQAAVPQTTKSQRKESQAEFQITELQAEVKPTEWEAWADKVIIGADCACNVRQTQLKRSMLTGQVLDQASLETFWYELTHRAYGDVQRAKGIFEVADGRSLLFNFVAGSVEMEITELDLPRWVEGRPERFSGIEVLGDGLEQSAITQTLTDCCLEEAAIAYYQAQVRAALGTGLGAETP